MNPTPVACWLLTATLLAAADAPQGDTAPRDPQPAVQRPQRDRANGQGNTGDTPRLQRPNVERTPTVPPLSGWVYIPPQGGQNGPTPPKPDFIPGNPGQEPGVPGRNIQTPFGNGAGTPNESGRGFNANTQPQNQVQRRPNGLTPDEQHKLQATMEKLKDHADLKEAREVALKARKEAEETARKERELTEAAALKLDPSLAPLFEKMRRAGAIQNPIRSNGSAPTPEEIAAFREQMRARQNEQPQPRRGQEAPAR
ncbi:MAG: hypothetical protein LW857_04555 [Verrucomicrobiae bacterium]|nr:hypothetical protein [Verrucomicrobiae bacterium]